MNVRTATVLEVDQDVQTARTAARGILAAASNLRTAAAGDLLARAGPARHGGLPKLAGSPSAKGKGRLAAALCVFSRRGAIRSPTPDPSCSDGTQRSRVRQTQASSLPKSLALE